MKRIAATISVVFLFAITSALLLAQEENRFEVKTIDLGKGISMISTGAGGNLAACVGDDGVLLVDSEYAPLAAKVKTAIAALSAEPVSYVVNTHWHFDHVGGNELFAGDGALIVAHENVRKRMKTGQRIEVINVQVPASPEGALPAVTFSDTITFRLNGEEIRVYHPEAAHTDGDGVVVFAKANVIHTGDVVFYPGYPFIDISSNGSIDGVIAAVKGILAICDDETKIIPGHGPLMKKAELEEYLAMLEAFRAIIAAEIAAGKDLETILAEKPTAELDKKWGDKIFPPHQFTEIVFRSLKGE